LKPKKAVFLNYENTAFLVFTASAFREYSKARVSPYKPKPKKRVAALHAAPNLLVLYPKQNFVCYITTSINV